MTQEGHGGMACLAQEYHGDGDVNGSLCKIGNMRITNVNEWKACYMGKETKGSEVTGVRGRMTSW
jgi:hypothetical protein